MGELRTLQSTITRPADTNQYAVDDVMADATGDACFDLSGLAGQDGRAVRIRTVRLVTPQNSIVQAPRLRLYFFGSAPTLIADGDTFAPSDADIAKLVGVINLEDGEWYAGANNTFAFKSVDVVCPILDRASSATGPRPLFAMPSWLSAYVPESGEQFTLTVTAEQL